MDSTAMTIRHLVKKGLLHPDAAHKHRARHERYGEILRGEGKIASEAQVTTFMTMFGGDLEDAVIGYLCDAAGVEDRTGFWHLPSGPKIVSGTPRI